MSRPPATISVDVDPVDVHLVGYGHRGLPRDPLVYRSAIPRLLASFAAAHVRATFFVLGADAAENAETLRAMVGAGHEVASHSHTHPFAFASLPEEAQRRELEDSRRSLSAASGSEVSGFRAPNFDFDDAAARVLASCGYRYDASAYPTPFLLPARLVMALKSREPATLLRMRWHSFRWERMPGEIQTSAGRLVEFPVSVTPRIRFPVYHTARYVTGDLRFDAILDGFVRRREPLSYALHAVDALGLAEDGVDARLRVHPGMEHTLANKRALLDRTLAALTARFDVATFRERLGTG
jgi:peptidoglycan-N-acetylglucosamine deacetylase